MSWVVVVVVVVASNISIIELLHLAKKGDLSDFKSALMNYLTLNILPVLAFYLVACGISYRRRVNNRFHYLFILKVYYLLVSTDF